ncbi:MULTISPECIES: hypothetical protein [unclassified Massilia]|uniref:hypothetical protein n=1 Tax=unclassified Massilia TaxID=2609279 RepID=UPI00178365A8|nr:MULTISPECIES: hypothetical protein [unclassified Massilia]MBD8530357.1 hypothetical protein [Massilia sp. CFBP 13647]MBD8673134.1 hypothetical protein [Massilia sp. CFBP 13721]
MRHAYRLHRLLPACLLLLASAASARTMPYPQVDDDTAGSTVQVTAPAASAFVTPDQAREIAGSYSMSNGWRTKVSMVSGRYIEARIDSEKPMRLRSVGNDTFVSRDGKVSMRFRQGEFADGMTMSFVPDGRLAQVVVLSSRIAQR